MGTEDPQNDAKPLSVALARAKPCKAAKRLIPIPIAADDAAPGDVKRSLRQQLARSLKAMSPFSKDLSSGDAEAKRQTELQSLTGRQRETLMRLLAGDGEKQIAYRLKISQHTVHVYVKQLYVRYGVSSRGELLAQWIDGSFSDRTESATRNKHSI